MTSEATQLWRWSWLDELTNRVWNGNFTPVANAIAPQLKALGVELREWPDLWCEVLVYVMAHELGHARQAEQRLWLPAVQLENDADAHAGAVARRLGMDPVVGEMIARALGCNGLSCQHGSPEARACSYRVRYELGALALAG